MKENEMVVFDEYQFQQYLYHLNEVSDVWADMFMFIYITKWSFKNSATLTFDDYFLCCDNSNFIVTTEPHRKIVDSIIQARRKLYMNDKYVFQSHSNRVKFNAQPVTSPAFNVALKIAALNSGGDITSSKSIRKMRFVNSSL